jgi:hypothetical protein
MHYKLTEEIIKLSNSDIWSSAKLECNLSTRLLIQYLKNNNYVAR